MTGMGDATFYISSIGYLSDDGGASVPRDVAVFRSWSVSGKDKHGEERRLVLGVPLDVTTDDVFVVAAEAWRALYGGFSDYS